jgi:hypothetical protein
MDKVFNTKALLFLPIIFLAIYFCAGIFFEPKFVIYVKPFIIPTFMIYAVQSNVKKLSRYYFLFVFFFYLNEVVLLFWEHSLHLYRAALIASFFGYFTLAYLGYRSIKNADIQTVLSGYSLFILVLNCIFLFTIIYILASVISDEYVILIIIFNAISTIVLGAIAVLYLGKFGDKKAYFYFFGAFALIFNDIFAAIGSYFVENVFLNTLDRVLHFACFYLIYLFIVTRRKTEYIQIMDV